MSAGPNNADNEQDRDAHERYAQRRVSPGRERPPRLTLNEVEHQGADGSARRKGATAMKPRLDAGALSGRQLSTATETPSVSKVPP